MDTLKRTEPIRFRTVAEQVEDAEPNYGVGDPPDGLLSADQLRHGQRRVLSLIDVDLWNAAHWSGMAVLLFPSGTPGLAFLFRNERAAQRIFEEWRGQFGRADEEDIIRVTIVTGIDQHHPSSNAVVLSTNFEKAFKDRKPIDQAIVISRIQRVDKPDPINLEMLVSKHRSSGQYILMAAILSDDMRQARPLTETGILKRELNVRPAWQIGEHDPDSSPLSPDDEPIIPDGVVDPPVQRALRRRREQAC